MAKRSPKPPVGKKPLRKAKAKKAVEPASVEAPVEEPVRDWDEVPLAAAEVPPPDDRMDHETAPDAIPARESAENDELPEAIFAVEPLAGPPAGADSDPAEPRVEMNLADLSKVAPRASPGDAFESNPLSALREAAKDGTARHALDDSTRVREALRSVIEQGDTVKEAAREWKVAPSAIAEWRAKYQDLLKEDAVPESPLMEFERRPQVDSSVYIPEAAREIFLENWERLVRETAATPSDFVQSPGQIFLQTSRLTSWLFQEGQLDRGILSGSVSCVLGLAILTSFLMADRNAVTGVPLPEPAPREDLAINEAAAVAQAFFKADRWEERLVFVRQPEAVRGMMQAYYQDHADGPISDAMLAEAIPSRHLVNLSFEIPSLNRSHFLCVVLSRGRHLVDWESSSLYQEEQLGRLRAARSMEPTRIAVTVTKSEAANYYNYAFNDPARWECYQLGYPGLNLNLFGYALKDSADAISLNAMLGIVDKHPAVLEVRFPPDSQTDNQVEIVGVLRGEWVPLEP